MVSDTWKKLFTDSNVILCDEDADDGGEELGSWSAGRHERRSCHVGADLKLEKVIKSFSGCR